MYLAGLLRFWFDTNEYSQIVHHLRQRAGICSSILSHVKHQTHRQTVLKNPPKNMKFKTTD